MRPTQLLSTALLCTSLTSAFSWPDAALDLVEYVRPYQRRSPQVQTLGDTNAASPNPTQVISSTAKATSASAAQTTGDTKSSASDAKSSSDKAAATTGESAATTSGGKAASSGETSSGKSTGKSTGKTTGSGKSTGTATSKHTSSAVDPRLPAGGLSMITPNPLSSTQYYKIGNYITFGWNYTSLVNTPSAIDILASCSANQATYTLALNQSITASTGALTWDTNEYQKTATVQLLTEKYTLIIYDAASSISATAAAGDLGMWNQFTFGMYTPQPYVGIQDFVCATCSGASGLMEKQVLGFMLGMATITVVTFTSFLGGAGVLF